MNERFLDVNKLLFNPCQVVKKYFNYIFKKKINPVWKQLQLLLSIITELKQELKYLHEC